MSQQHCHFEASSHALAALPIASAHSETSAVRIRAASPLPSMVPSRDRWSTRAGGLTLRFIIDIKNIL
jgi:hypothetical protein